ncbi:F0F1 ATP synthase subunit delta [Marinicellulosiphila megalodicopiae]|uniref:F0F1 ATP synthase subunit delta n=1 Tax=Marinicellulosiphila megalodicopiae TaxID=2724896 RepID=UPI003BB20799
MAELSTYARPYAKASFAVASDQNALAKWSDMLSTLASVTLDEKVSIVLGNPGLTASDKANFIKELCGEELNEEAIHLVNTLAENHRLSLLAEIATQFDLLKAEQEGSVDVVITSAIALTPAQQSTLSEKLAAKLGRDVSITTEIDPSIIGGAIIRANDLVIDGSVSGKLAKLAEAMNS